MTALFLASAFFAELFKRVQGVPVLDLQLASKKALQGIIFTNYVEYLEGFQAKENCLLLDKSIVFIQQAPFKSHYETGFTGTVSADNRERMYSSGYAGNNVAKDTRYIGCYNILEIILDSNLYID